MCFENNVFENLNAKKGEGQIFAFDNWNGFPSLTDNLNPSVYMANNIFRNS